MPLVSVGAIRVISGFVLFQQVRKEPAGACLSQWEMLTWSHLTPESGILLP